MGVVEGVVPIPKGIKPINSRMVYDWKDPVSQEGAHQFGEGEAPERLAKCRLTMKDMKNVPNYLSNVVREVFAPTGQGVTFRLLIVLMLLLGLICDHIDVSTAFLYATLDHPIFMNPPSGYPCKEGHCLKIVRALYGCRAAPREWFKLLRDFILSLGFLESALDQCLFHRGAGPTLFLIFIYVDDILLFCADANLRKEVKDRFFIRFRCKDLGEVKRFLGVWIEVAKDRSSALLHQRQYCHKIVETFRPFWDIFKSVRKYPLPVDIQEKIHVEGPEMTPDHPQFEWWNNFPYMEMTGSALYLAIQTRVDICFAICLLARYALKKSLAACMAMAHLFSYLSGTMERGITYTVSECASRLFDDWLDMYGMSDADWAGCLRTRRSTAGYWVSALGGPIAWGSKFMATIATSSMESEYMAAYYLGQTLIFIRNLLKEIGLPMTRPTRFFMDAMAAIMAMKNGHVSARTKHFDIKWRWLVQGAVRKLFEFLHLRSGDMTSDLLTKMPGLVQTWLELVNHLSGAEIRTSRMLMEAQKREKGTSFPSDLLK
jgi:hypothetical protein